MLDQELVRACYRLILGREAENEAVVRAKAELSPSFEALLREFLESPEYLNKVPAAVRQQFGLPPNRIDIDVSDSHRAALFQRVQGQWSQLGEAEPYWSVLTHDRFKRQNLTDERLEAFFASGEEAANYIDAFCERAGTHINRDLCLELGCGVGRITKHLARRFKAVVAVDVSPGNLHECRQTLDKSGITNVDCVLLRKLQDVETLPSHDCLFSLLTLQHNEPPVQKYILDVLLGKIRDEGGFFIQTSTHLPGYAFIIDEYLKSEPPAMSHHCLPMPVIFGLLERHALSPLEVIMDAQSGYFGSHTFFGKKTRARHAFAAG